MFTSRFLTFKNIKLNFTYKGACQPKFASQLNAWFVSIRFFILAIAAIVAIAEFIFEQWRDDRSDHMKAGF